MEESISGFKMTGDWGEVVEHGERVTEALLEAGVDEEGGAFEEWNEWRPKPHERLGKDLNRKTAEQASVDEGAGEAAGKDPDDDLRTAGEKLSESYDAVENGQSDAAVESWQDSLDYVARAADSAGRRALRAVEDTVYRRVMTQFAPYYFDNELVSANVQRSRRRGGDDVAFVLEVNVNDDDLKEEVSELLAAYDDVDRWHLETEKDTTVAEAAEGVQPTPAETGADDERD